MLLQGTPAYCHFGGVSPVIKKRKLEIVTRSDCRIVNGKNFFLSEINSNNLKSMYSQVSSRMDWHGCSP
jgi:hypothetical protein